MLLLNCNSTEFCSATVISGSLKIALEIETHVTPGGGRTTIEGILTGRGTVRALAVSDDDWADWIVDGVTYTADTAIEVGARSQSPMIGQSVRLNTYQNNGVTYVTSAVATRQVYLPLILRFR